MAVWIPWARVLVAGDYLSPVEIPSLDAGGLLDAYLATLQRLRPLVEEAERVVPGHGPAMASSRASRILEEDLAYLRALAESHPRTVLPAGRRGAHQRRLHRRNAGGSATGARGG